MNEYKYKDYDLIVAKTFQYIGEYMKNKKELVFKNFNCKNKKHLYVVSVCEMSSNIYNFKLSIKSKKISYLIYKIFNRKANVSLAKKNCTACDIDRFIEELDSLFKDFEGFYYNIFDNRIYEKIYDAYYNPKNLRKENKK